ITTRRRSLILYVSRRDCSRLGMRASARPRSTITSGPSVRLTTQFTSSPTRPLYSLKMVSRSASRTFCMITCLAVCAAIRPSTSVGFGMTTSLPISALGSIRFASASENIFFGLVKLPRGNDHRVFDRGDDHLRFNVLFPADLLNGLVQQIGHLSLISEFDNQVRFANSFHRQSNHPAF